MSSPPAPADPIAQRGQEVFLTSRCASCHAVAGTPAFGTVGPDLTHLASRKGLAMGTLANDQRHLSQWISDPQQSKPGVQMPGTPAFFRGPEGVARVPRRTQMNSALEPAGLGRQPTTLQSTTRSALYDWLASTEHTSLGCRFIVTALGFFVLGGILALIMRLQLATPLAHVVGPDRYNQIFSTHGTTIDVPVRGAG